jgi:hypothetical protein
VSIPVELAALPEQISRSGPSAILVTTAADGRPHVCSVLVAFEHDDLVMRVGRGSRTNAAERPAVTIVWPAAIDDDYCLIVDAAARNVPPDAETLVVQPTSAVLHRLAVA